MQTVWRRIAASGLAGRWLWLTCTGVAILLVATWTTTISADDPTLQRVANQSQVFGVLLAALGGLAGIFGALQRKLRGDQDLADWTVQLASRVSRAERVNRAALLGGTHAADLRLGRGIRAAPNEMLETWYSFDDESPIRLSDLRDHIETLGPNARLVITGEPGSGKTLSAIQLVLELIEQRSAGRPIPVRFSLASWEQNVTAEEWMATQVAINYGVPRNVADELILDRTIMPVLDGLDEMDRGSDRPLQSSRAAALVSWLNGAYLKGASLAPAIITCRAEEYDGLSASNRAISHGEVVRILSLRPDEIREHIHNYFQDSPSLLRAWQPVLVRLGPARFAPIWNCLATPWRLTLAIVAVG